MDVDLELALKKTTRWLPKNTLKNVVVIEELLMGCFKENKLIYNMVKVYVDIIYPYLDLLGLSDGKHVEPSEYDCSASGFIFFYLCLGYLLHFPNFHKYIEDICLYNMLYMLVDHYIDNQCIDNVVKTNVISDMKSILDNQNIDYDANPILKHIHIIYNKLLNRNKNKPLFMENVRNLFKYEVENLHVQNSPNMNAKTYFDVSISKGGYTMLVLQSIIEDSNPDTSKATYELGLIMQLIDDCQDVIIDTQKNINTIATFEYKHRGNIDHLWIDIINRVTHIDAKFNIFKIFFMFVLLYLPNKNPELYSKKLLVACESLNLLNKFKGKFAMDNMLVESIAIEILSRN